MKKRLMSVIAASVLLSSVACASKVDEHFLHFKTDPSVDFNKLQNKFGSSTPVEIEFLIKRSDGSYVSTSTVGLLKNITNWTIEGRELSLVGFDLSQKHDAKYIASINIVDINNSKVLYAAAIQQPAHPLDVTKDYYMHIHSLNNNDASVDDNPA